MHPSISDDDGPTRGRSTSATSFYSAIAEERGTRRGTVESIGKGSSPRRRRSSGNDPKNERADRRQRKLKLTNRPSRMDRLAAYVVDHQIRFSLFAMSCLAASYIFVPFLRPTVEKFYRLSYYNPTTGRFGKGADDGYFVAFWVIVFTFLRAAAFDHVFNPIGKKWGVSTDKNLMRFSEQAWLIAYYAFIWPLGLYLMYNSPYWMDVNQLWTDWPVRELDAWFKWYYLVQFAFWLHQIVVLNIEPRRKDYHQMFSHHIITVSLMIASYTYHMTRVGNVILCIMDIGDVLLGIAKNLKYTGYNVLADYAFGVFLISWILGRHVSYIRIVISAWKDSVKNIPFGCYISESTAPIPIPENASDYWTISQTFSYNTDLVCFTKTIQMSFITLLSALQVITIAWFCMILAIAWKVVRGGGAEDTRSDDENEEVEEVEHSNGHVVPEKPSAWVESIPKARGTPPSSPPMISAPALSVMNGHSHHHLSTQPLGSGE